MRLVPMLVLAALATPAIAQGGGKVQVFSSQQMQAQLATLQRQDKAAHGGSAALGDYTTHMLMISERTATGEAERHAHYNDIIVVTGGRATLRTGGVLTNSHTVSEGETKGSIQGGTSQPIHRGDVVHIPAGTPHQLVIPPGVTFTAFVVKVKQ